MAPPAASSSTRSPDPAYRRSLVTALAAGAALVAHPVSAQNRETTQALEDLIPDSAIDDPEGWAEQGAPDNGQAENETLPEVDTDLADMPLVDVPWPDELELPAIEQVEPEDDIQFADDLAAPSSTLLEGDEVKLARDLTIVFPTELSLFPERDDFLQRFRQLSTIEGNDAGDNAARLAAQARSDEALLQRLLRIYGYYDAQVIRSVGTEATGDATGSERATVRFDVIPGKQYALGAIDLGELAATGSDYRDLLGAFGVTSGDPLNSITIEAGQAALDTALGEAGYPFAAIDDPSLLVDHDRQEGDLTMKVTPGGKYRFGAVTSNLPKFMSGKHLADIARFEPGDLYKRSDEMDLRRAVQATGLVASTTITPVEVTPPSGDEPGVVDMQVEMTKAKLRTLAGSIGYGTGEGFKLAGSWEHRNLFPPEGALKVRGIAGTQEQLLGVTFRRNNFHGRDQVLTIDAYGSTIDYAAYDAQTLSLVGTFERVSTLLYQKKFSWSGGLELIATKEREAKKNGKAGVWQTYFIAALPGYAQWDTSDDLLNPTKGFRIAARLSPEVARTNGTQSFYLRGQLDGSYYKQVSDKLVVAGRARFASIPGTSTLNIAPSRRLYGGGGGSVRGYGYQAIGPQNALGNPIGGRSLAEFSLEARIQTGFLDGALGIVPFVDAGTVGSSSTPDFDEIKIGAGIGIRYFTGFGPIRVDLGVPLNPGPNDAKFGVYVGLGQAF